MAQDGPGRKRLRIAVLAGGWSNEREVSLLSGETVFRELDRAKYEVMRLDPREDLGALMEGAGKIDLAFPLLHGKMGEDGCIQGVLRVLGIPFVGSGVLSSAMALNKRVAKQRFQGGGLAVAREVHLVRGKRYEAAHVMDSMGFEAVVKPVTGGSSIGMSIVRTVEELREAVEKAFEQDEEVLVEEFVEGCEVTACVIGGRDVETLPLVEIVPPKREGGFFDYEAKYTPGATQEICPARLEREVSERAGACAEVAHQVLFCEGWSRTDMIIRGDEIVVLETNTIPGMTKNSLFPLAARTAGMALSALLDRLISLSVQDD